MTTTKTKAKNFSDQLAIAVQLIVDAAETAASMVEKAPDNPKITRNHSDKEDQSKGELEGAKSPRVRSFIISSSEVFATKNLSVYFHDWKSQYEDVAKLLRDGRFSAVKSVLKEGKYHDSPTDKKVFAPQVITHLRSILGELDEFTVNSAQKTDQIHIKRRMRLG